MERSAVNTAKEHQAAALETAARRLRAVQSVAFDVLPITEREYIERALAFASWDGKDSACLMQLNLELQIGCTAINKDGELQRLEATARLAATISPPGISVARFRRDNMRESLKAIVDAHERFGHGQRTKKWKTLMPPGIVKTGSDTRGHAVAIWKGQEAFGEPTWMYFPVDIGAAIKIAFDLLTDSTRPYGSSLRQCQLSTCGGYFLLPSPPGRGQPTNMHPECKKQWRNKDRHKQKSRRSR